MKQKNLFISFLLVLFIFHFFKLPYSTYNLLKWDVENRMTQSYGYCERESWGFYNHVINKFDLKDKTIKIINHQGHVTLEFLFNLEKSSGEHYRLSNENQKDINYYLILNYQSTNDESIFDNFKNLKDYKILYRYNNCYLLSNA
mgnify:FL=1